MSPVQVVAGGPYEREGQRAQRLLDAQLGRVADQALPQRGDAPEQPAVALVSGEPGNGVDGRGQSQTDRETDRRQQQGEREHGARPALEGEIGGEGGLRGTGEADDGIDEHSEASEHHKPQREPGHRAALSGNVGKAGPPDRNREDRHRDPCGGRVRGVVPARHERLRDVIDGAPVGGEEQQCLRRNNAAGDKGGGSQASAGETVAPHGLLHDHVEQGHGHDGQRVEEKVGGVGVAEPGVHRVVDRLRLQAHGQREDREEREQ